VQTPISPQAFSELIGAVYDCALDPGRWDRTLSELRDAFLGQTAGLGLLDLRRGRILISKDVGLEPEQLEERARHSAELSAWMAAWISRNPLDAPHVLSRHLAPSDWETSPYFRMGRNAGFIDVLQHYLIWDEDHIAVFAAGRLAPQGIFSEREIELGRLLLPHLRRAVTISKVLDARTIERDRVADALDALNCGVVLTERSGAILHANRAAERMMRDGDLIQGVRGALQAKAPAAMKELRSAIALAADDETALGKTGLAIRLTEGDQPPVFAHVLPLAGGETRARLEPQAAAAVFIGAAPGEHQGADAMAAAFGLTAAETRLVESLLAGRSLAETAAALGVAMTTAKTHLDNIFQKTGVHRQADLVRLAGRVVSPASPTNAGR
jgi:DNA-binding CsgD family transcriptional regulator/PAS domain-containing protein